MHVVVPFDAAAPKTRLAPLLDDSERHALASCMLGDVLDAVTSTHESVSTVDVLATAPLDDDNDHHGQDHADVGVTVDDRPLTDAVNDVVTDTLPDEPLAVVMADLGLATPSALTRLYGTAGDVVLVPGRGVGTNALVVRTPAFRVDFHGTSYLDHRLAAERVGASVETVDSFRLATDVDEPADLVEAFVHGGPRTVDWLTERFELTVDDEEGRVTLDRR
jgi:2-phospho-L-lactate guanylyltransferase